MKFKLKILLAAFSLILLCTSFASCSREKFSSSPDDLRKASEAVAEADAGTDALEDLALTYSYIAECTVNKTDYRLGCRNILKMTGRGTPSFSANRYHYYYGSNSSSSKTFNYSNGSLYTEYCNTQFRIPMTEPEFIEYTENTLYSADPGFLDTGSYGSVSVKSSGGKVSSIIFKDDDGTVGKKICSYFGLTDTDYVYGVNDISLTVSIKDDGTLSEKLLTFTLTYSSLNAPENSIVYNGSFSCKVDATSDISVTAPTVTDGIQEISDPSLVENFSDNAYGVLSTFTTLDASYHRYVRNTDYLGTEYILDNLVHFTEAYRDGIYSYGSIDSQRLKTPNSDETISNGLFIDKNGYHTRSTSSDSEPVNGGEKPYDDVEFIYMVFQTLSGERAAESDMKSLNVTETVVWIQHNGKDGKYQGA